MQNSTSAVRAAGTCCLCNSAVTGKGSEKSFSRLKRFSMKVFVAVIGFLWLPANRLLAQTSAPDHGRESASGVLNFSSMAAYELAHPPALIVRGDIEDDNDFSFTMPRHAMDPSLPIGVLPSGGRTPSLPTTFTPSPSPADTFQAAIDNGSSIPPDTHGAVDTNYCVEVTNQVVKIQSRSSSAISSVSLDGFWSPVLSSGGSFDPRVYYDIYQHRWYIIAVSGGNSTSSSVLIAVSHTSNPTGSWYEFKVTADASGTNWLDYPVMGFNGKWITITGNYFAISGGAYNGGRIYAFNKANLLSGTSATYTGFTNTSVFTLCPAVTYDASLGSMFFVWSNGTSINDGTYCYTQLYKMTGSVGSESMSAVGYSRGFGMWGYNAASGGDFAPQLGTTNKVQTNDDRVSELRYMNGYLWFAHTVFTPYASPTHAMIQYWQIDTTAGVVQNGLLQDTTTGMYYAFPSIAVNSSNDFLIGFSAMSSGIHPSAAYALHMHSDAGSTIRTPFIYRHGQNTYYKTYSGTRNRWGDYSGATVDITNMTDFYTVQEAVYTTADDYDTWWAHVLTPCTAPGSITGTATVCAGSTTALTDATSGGTWSSSNTGVATVGSSTGTVTGISAGTAMITYATASSCYSTITVTVYALPSSITGTASVCAGSTTNLTDATSGGAWTSGNTAVATITSGGVVTGVSSGTSIISYTSSSGCRVTATVTVNAAPLAITGTTSVCAGSTTNLTDATTGGSWGSSATGVATVTSGGVVTGVASGTALISYQLASGCKVQTVVTVNPTPGSILGTASVCAGSTTSLTDATTGGSWTSSNTGVATVTGSGTTVFGVTAGTSFISYTLPTGCKASTIVTVNATPAAISGSTAVCTGGTITLSETSTGGAWGSSNTAKATVTSGGIVTGVSAGTAVISYAFTSGCKASVTVTVSTAPSPITGATSLCSGSTTALTDAGGGTWSSTNTAVASVNVSTGVVFGVAAGSATISYVLGGSCSATTVVTVTASPSIINGGSVVCAGSTLSLSDATGGGSWFSGSTGVATVSGTGTVGGVSAGTVTISYMVGSCFATKVVTVNAAPSASAILGSSSVAVSSTITLSDATTGGVWSSSNTSVATITSGGVVNGVTAGTTTISYGVTNTCGTAYATRVVTVVPTTTGTIMGPTSVCEGSTVTLSDTVGGGSWFSGNAAVATVDGAGDVTGVSAGTAYIYYLTGTGTDSILFTVNALPASISGPTSVCLGSTITLSDSSPGGTWSSSDITIATVGSTTGIVGGVSASSVIISYSSAAGCVATTLISVNSPTTISAISGASSLFTGFVTGYFDATSGGTWSSSNTSVLTIDPSSGNATAVSAGVATITYSGITCSTGPATLSVTVTGTSPTIACPAITSVMTSNDTSICSGTCINLSGSDTTTRKATTNYTVYPIAYSPYSFSAGTAVSEGDDTYSDTVGIPFPFSFWGSTYTQLLIGSNGNISFNTSLALGYDPWPEGSLPGNNGDQSFNAIMCPHQDLVGGTGVGTFTYATYGTAPCRVFVISYDSIPQYSCGYYCSQQIVLHEGTNDIDIFVRDKPICPGWNSGDATLAIENASGSNFVAYPGYNGTNWTATNFACRFSPSDAASWSFAWTDTTGSTIGTASTVSVCPTASSKYYLTGVSAAGDTVTVVDSVSVTVIPAPSAISGATTVCAGSTSALTDATAGGTWHSGNTAVATVGLSTGIVTGVSAGTSIITYATTCGTATITVTVHAAPAPISGTAVVCVGGDYVLSDATGGGAWSSSNTSVATVGTSGIYYGVSVGTAIISYTGGSGCSATLTIAVTPASNTYSYTGSVQTYVVPPAITQLAVDMAGGSGGDYSSPVFGARGYGGRVQCTLSVTPGQVLYIYVGQQGTSASGFPSVAPPGGDNSGGGANGGAGSTSDGGAAGGAASDIRTISGSTSTALSSRLVVAGGGGGGAWACGGEYGGGGGGLTGGFGIYCGSYDVTSEGGPGTQTSGGAAGCGGTNCGTAGGFGPGGDAYNAYWGGGGGGGWYGGGGAYQGGGSGGSSYTDPVAATSVTHTQGYNSSDGYVNINPIFVAPIAGTVLGATSVCAGSSVTFSDPTGTPLGTWTSSNTTIATVNSITGVATGVAGGVDTISYTITNCGGTATAFVTLTVMPVPATISGTAAVCAGSTTVLSDAIAGGTWHSSNTSVATVTSSGTVTGVTAGTSTISYSNSCGMATIVVTVNALPGVTTVAGASACGSTTITASGGSGGTIYYQGTTSGGTSTATPSTSQLITASGTYYFRAQNAAGCWGTQGSVTVVINPMPGPISGASSVCTGTTTTLSDTTSGGTWSSSATAKATVGLSTGVVTGVTAGSTIITYKLSTGCYVTSTMTVFAPAAITGVASVNVGSTTTLSNAISGGSWSSSNTAIATVGVSTGVVSGVSVGTAVISYSLGTGCTSTITVTVNPVASGISGTALLCAGATSNLTDSTSGGTWSSSNTTVAVVGSTTGVVTGVSGGTSIITYAVGSSTATITVTVIAAPTISSLSVSMGYPAASVTITGTGFNPAAANNIVYFGATQATVSSASSTSLGVSVPYGATFVPVSADNTNCYLTAYSQYQFLPTYNNSAYASGALNFNSKVDFTSGTNPFAVAIGDLDGDGKADIAAVNNGASTVSVFRNTSTTGVINSSSFAAKVDFATGTSPYSVTIGDVDNDGKLDIVTTNNGASSVSVLRNTSTSGSITSGSFAGKVDFATGSGPVRTEIADLDMDGRADLCVANYGGNSVSLLRNTGSSGSVTSSSFAAHADISTASHPFGMAIADIDGDGKPDMIVPCQGATLVSVFRNTSTVGTLGSGSFASAYNLTTGSLPYAVAVGDIDGDGKPDIVAANYGSATVSAFRNTSSAGSVSLAAKVDFTVGTNPYFVAMGDLDGDGKPDLVAANSGSNTVSMLRNNTTSSGAFTSSTFAPKVDVATGTMPRSVAICDLDGDGIPDIAVSNFTANTVSVIRNNPISQISGTLSICGAGSTTSLSDATSGGTWSSSNTAVATVTSTGTVTGVSAGTANITYTLTGGRAIATVTVGSAPAITGTTTVCAGLTTTLSDATGGGSWFSSNTSVATIDGTGLVSGVSAGTTTISYVTGSCTTTITVTVNPLPSSISGAGSVCAGSTITLSDATSGGTWTSGSTSIATVTGSTGVVSGVSSGTSVITYSVASGCYTTAVITVNSLPSAISGTRGVCIGAVTALSDASGSGSWSSSNTTVATIDVSGLVSGVAAGTSTITFLAGTGCRTTAVVTVYPLPSAILGTTSACQGATTSLSDPTGGGTWSSSNMSVATIGTSGSVTGVGAGTSIITYTASTGCFATTVVTINPLPSAISGTTMICSGTTSTLSDSLSGGMWSSSNSSIAPVGSTSGVVNGTLAGSATITYTMPTGCKTTTGFTVNMTPAAISGASSVCIGSTLALSDGTSGGSWSSSDITIASVSGTGVVTGVSVGTVAITYAMASGCYVTKVVTSNSAPSAITGTMSTCIGASTTLTDSVSGGAWTSSASGIASVSGGIVTGVVAGTANITYSIGSCRAITNVTVYALPAAISGSSSVCVSSTITLSDATSGGSFSTSDATVSLAGGAVTGVSAGTATITYTSALGCMVTKIVTVNPLPSAISGASAICAGTTTTYSDAGSGTWGSSNTGVASVNSSTGVVSGISAGTATITFTLATGCYTTAVITVNPNPSAITGTLSVCASGATTTLSDATGGGSWSSSSSSVASIDPSSGVVTGGTAGTAVITYSLGTGCIATAVVTVNPLPSAISGASAICAGASTTYSDGGTGAWSSSNIGVATVNAATGLVAGISAGTANITFTLSTGCYVTSMITINPNPSVISGILTVCASGSTTSLSDSTTGGSWSSSNTAVASVDPSSGVVTGGSSGTATITYTLGTGCLATAVVTVNALPTISGLSTICDGSTTTLSGSGSGSWSSSNTGVATVNPSGVVTGVSSGTAIITYTAAGTGCMAFDTVTVSSGLTVASITGNTTLSTAITTALSDATSGGSWSSSNTGVATVDGSGNVYGVTAGTSVISYTITSGSCSATATVVVTVNNVQNGLNFDGSDDYVGLGTILSTNHSYTKEAWVYASATTSNNIISSPDAPFWITSGHLSAAQNFLTLSTTISDPATFPTGQWVHVAITYDAPSTTMTLYKNGAVVASTTSAPAYSAGNIQIGAYTGSNNFQGNIDEVRIWDIALPQSTILANMNCDVPQQTDLVAYYRFNQGTAGGTNTGISTATDYSGNFNCGTLNNFAMTGSTSNFVSGALGSCNAITLSVPSISGTASACVGSTTTLSDAVSGGAWSSSNTSVATIDASSGVATGVLAGTTTITYNVCGSTATTTMTVIALPSSITGTTSVCAGATTALTDATTGGSWASGNTGVATITSGGVVSGVSAGTSIITYTAATGCSVTTVVTVNPAPPAISGASGVCVGATITLSDATTGGIWTSSSTAVAAVGSSTGVVTGVAAPATATITYALSTGCSVTTVITVNALPMAISGTAVVCVSSTITLTDATGGGSWTSNDMSIATAGSGTGVVTGVGGGVTTITYTLATGCYATKAVTVNPGPGAISGPTSFCGGSVATLSDATTGGTWSSSNTVVATIGSTSGVLSAVSNGTTIITYATSCGSVTTTVTVGGGPVITSVTPNIDTVLGTVVIAGSNFNSTAANNIVYFGATMGTVTSASPTSLSVTVPFGSTFRPITVENTGCQLTAYAQYPFLPSYDNGPFIPTTINLNTHVDFTAGNSTFGVAIGDIDGDGKADLVASNIGANTISVYRNTSTSGTINSGSFAAKVDFATGSSPYGVAIGDLDNDGKLDIVVANFVSAPPTVSIFHNTATSGVINSSSLAAGVTDSVGTGPIAVGIADFDGDGKADLAVANYGANTVSVLRNISTAGTLTSSSFAHKVDFAVTSGNHPYGIAVGDLDGDGKPDIAMPNQAAAAISVMRNTSTVGSITSGSFATPVYFSTGSQPYGIAEADIDGDGKLELISSNNSGPSVSVLRNTSTSGTIATGSFAGHIDFTTGAGPYGIAVGDINGDGKPDVVTANRGANTASILRNTATSGTISSSSFAAHVDVAIGANPAHIAVGDLDGDGLPDVVTANTGASTVSVLRNNPPLHPAPHSATTNSPATICVGETVTLGGSGGTWSIGNSNVADLDPATGIVTGLAAGRTAVTYTIAEGTGIALVITPIVVMPEPGAVAISAFPGTTLQKGQNVTFSVTVQNASALPQYLWQVNGKDVSGANAAVFTSNNLKDNDVVTCVVSSSTCEKQSVSNAVTVRILQSVDHQAVLAGWDVRVTPNPNNGTFTIKGTVGTSADEAVSMEVTDMLGQVVYRTDAVAKNGQLEEQIQLGKSLANGMYLINLHTDAGNRVFHFVVRR